MKKKHVIFIFIIFFISIIFLSYRNNPKNNGYESILINNSNIYLNISGEKVEYYRIKKGEILNCEKKSFESNSYFCAWYFSKGQEPMWGWVSSEDLIFDYKNWSNNGK